MSKIAAGREEFINVAIEIPAKQMTISIEQPTFALEPSFRTIAGAAAIAAAVAWFVWAYLNISTGGALDGPVSGISAAMAISAKLLTVAQNVLMAPAAVVLWQLTRRDF